MKGMSDLAGKTAVITGGGSGIGRSMATAFASEGMNVVVADVDVPAARETVAIIVERGGAAEDVECDVSSFNAVEALRDQAIERFGAVHVLCNNAGVGGGGNLDECSLATWEWVLSVNLWGVIHGVKAFLPALLEQNEGHIVNTASIAGQLSFPSMGPYNVSKFGVVTLSETLLGELQDKSSDVGVSVLCPGFVNTNILDSDRLRPEQFADPVVVADADDPLADESVRAMVADAYRAQLSPDAVAGVVVAAVKDGQFYLFTDDAFDAEVADRHTDIQQRRVPRSKGQLWERLMQ